MLSPLTTQFSRLLSKALTLSQTFKRSSKLALLSFPLWQLWWVTLTTADAKSTFYCSELLLLGCQAFAFLLF